MVIERYKNAKMKGQTGQVAKGIEQGAYPITAKKNYLAT